MNKTNELIPQDTDKLILQNIEIKFNYLVNSIKENKPDDRSELDRRYAILITDLEKCYAYFCQYVLN